MTRRDLLVFFGCAAAARPASELDLSAIPNFCSHEHWGSINSIGTIPGGFRCDYEQGAAPRGTTSLFDLLIEPYSRGLLGSSGVDRKFLAPGSGWNWYQSLHAALKPLWFSGIYQCTRRGIEALYGVDLMRLDAAGLQRLESAIDANYRRPTTWYSQAMSKAHFRGLIRPVHPEFYRQRESPEAAAEEARLMQTVMRIDPFLDFSTGPAERRKRMSELSGIEPADAQTWRAFLAYWFDQAASGGAVGIKQLQAYRRSLDFAVHREDEIRWSDVSEIENRKRQDWIVHECCRQAHERGWAHQVHVGTHNLPNSSPLPLAALARRYPKMKIVMIHCWPFLSEAGTLARQVPNIYIDTCWQPILNPAFFREAMRQWWNYVPINKLTCGHDATTVEMATGSSRFTREILADVLREQTRQGGFTDQQLRDAAQQVLHDNAVKLYS